MLRFEQAQAKLEVLKPWLQQFNIRIVGNSHIDMAWLWPWTETVEVVRNTFQSVLDLMREYPDFKFTMSSARTYEWMQEKYPDLFQQIEKRVKEGRWEIIGGMWVEPDLNMPDGESLVRQILVGKRYFQKNFGVDVKIGWNPDSFGYNYQLPQIYKKSGMDYFVTQKLLWAHEFTTFPYKLFWWQAPDGSRLLTYFPHDYAGGIDAEPLATDLSIWMPSIYGKTIPDKPEMMHLYGVGDHGGGPTRIMLDHAEQLQSSGCGISKARVQFRARLLWRHGEETSGHAGSHLGWRTLLRVSPGSVHDAGRNQAQDPAHRRTSAQRREICFPGFPLWAPLSAGWDGTGLEELAV